MISETAATGIVLSRTLNRSRTTLMWWTIGVVLYTVINVAIYPSMKDSILLQTSSYPQSLLDAFGLNNLDQLGPYLYAQVFLMLPLVLSFFPISQFAGALAGAEQRGGLDVVLTQPLKRRSLVLATWIAGAIGVAILLLITALCTWLTVLVIGENLSIGDALMAAWSVYPVTMALGSMGLLFSAILRANGAVLGISIGITFLLYLVDVVGKIDKDLDAIRYISPFRYFNDVFTYHVPWWHYALLIGVSLVLLVAAVKVFERKDIYT